MNAKISPYIFPGCYHEPPITDNGQKQPLQHISLGNIIYTVCNRTGISLDQVQTAGRCREISDTRHIIYYLADKHMNITSAHIGIQLGDNRHRTTAYHAIKKISNLIDSDKTFAQMISRMQTELRKIDFEINSKNQKQAA